VSVFDESFKAGCCKSWKIDFVSLCDIDDCARPNRALQMPVKLHFWHFLNPFAAILEILFHFTSHPSIGYPSEILASRTTKPSSYFALSHAHLLARAQEPSANAVKIAKLLSKLGFNTELPGSSQYILSMLSEMKPKDVTSIKEAFITYATPRFMKQFSLHLPYGYKEEYEKKVRSLDLERLAGLIKVCSFLQQTKAWVEAWKCAI